MAKRKKQTRKRQTLAWWEARRDEFKKTAETVAEIAARYSDESSLSAFKQQSNRHHWSDRRREFQSKQAQARAGNEGQALALTSQTQTDTRVAYALRARKIADSIVKEAERLVDGGKARSIDIARLASGLRACQSVEFAALGIASDTLILTDEDGGKAATWEELMRREREGAGLPAYNFNR